MPEDVRSARVDPKSSLGPILKSSWHVCLGWFMKKSARQRERERERERGRERERERQRERERERERGDEMR